MSENIARTPQEGLDQLLQELATLRNAGTRSPSFRAWRQATLTLIQRIYHGHPQASERFRRIPFSPSSNRADSNEQRNVYEKGCAEATAYLRELRDRIGEVDWSHLESVVSSESFEVGSTEDDFPTLDLPPGPDGPKAPAVRHPAAKSKPKKSKTAPARGVLGDLLKQAESKASRQAPPALPPEESRVPPPESEPAAPARSRGKRSSPGTKKKFGARLKDMLGFGDPQVPEPEVHDPAPEPVMPPPAAPVVSEQPPVFEPHVLEPAVLEPPVPLPIAVPLETPPPPVAAAPPLRIDPSEILREMEAADLAAAPPAPEPPPPAAAAPPPALEVKPAATLKDMLLPGFEESLEASMEPEASAPPTPDPDRLQVEDGFADEWVSPNVPGPDELAEGLPPVTPTPPPPAPPPTMAPPPVAGPPPLAPPAPAADAPPARPHTDIFTAIEAFGPQASPRPPAAVPPPPAAAPPPPIARETSPPPLATPAPPAPAPEAGPDPTQEFFRTSPVLSSLARPVRPKGAEPPAAFRTQEAIELLAIAGAVGEFGVPAAQGAHTRLVLADLARRLENRELNWDQMREAIQFVLAYPALARRVLPLLTPHLDRAA